MADTPVSLARSVADAAAQRSGVSIVIPGDRAGQDAVRALFDETWPSASEGTQVTPNLLHALMHSGSYASLAVDRSTGEPVGAALGFPGHSDQVPGRLYLHSHMAAVRPELRNRRIGTALKLHQRWWAMDQAIPVISWTFDPLVRRNAFLNVIRLGVEVRAYHPDFYGEMDDAINAGDRTDRLVAWWIVDSPQAALAAAGELHAPDEDSLLPVSHVLLADRGGEPERGTDPSADDTVLVALPDDIVAIRQADPDRALRWRLAVREAIQAAYAIGLRVSTVTTKGSYVLSRHREVRP